MILRTFLVLTFVAFLFGCTSTTTTYQPSINFLQMRMGQLENDLAKKDRQIQDLRMEVSELRAGLQKQQSVVQEEQPVSEEESSPKEGLLRISVAPEKIQQALKKAGTYEGPIDGKVGQGTRSAIIEFQKSNGLTTDGVIGQKTWEKLEAYLE